METWKDISLTFPPDAAAATAAAIVLSTCSPWHPVPSYVDSILWVLETLSLWELCAPSHCLQTWAQTAALTAKSGIKQVKKLLPTFWIRAQVDFHTRGSEDRFSPRVHDKLEIREARWFYCCSARETLLCVFKVCFQEHTHFWWWNIHVNAHTHMNAHTWITQNEVREGI